MALLPTGTVYSNTESFREFSETVKLVRGDTGGELSVTLKDSNKAADGATLNPNDSSTWAPLNLTDASILLKLKAEGSSELKVSVPMYRVEPYTSGQLFLQWPANALDTAGMYSGEIEVTYASGQVLTIYKELRFQVREDY
jgi:hypothetical protein